MKPIEINDSTFEQEVVQNPNLTIVDFWAPWCGPCRIIAPTLESIAQQFDGQLKVTKVNVDENPVTAGAYGVHAIPTLLFFKNGKVIDRLLGVVPRSQLVARINRLLLEAPEILQQRES